MTLVEKYKDGGGLVKHALSEFRYAGWMDADGRFNDEGAGDDVRLRSFAAAQYGGARTQRRFRRLSHITF